MDRHSEASADGVPTPAPSNPPPLRTAVEVAVRLGVIGLLVVWCLQIVAPFLGIVVWALVIAIAADGFCARLSAVLGGRRGLAALLFVLLGLAVILGPAVVLSETLVSGAQHFSAEITEGQARVPPPSPDVARWPVVGPQVHAAWQLASDNLGEALGRVAPQLRAASAWLLRAAGQAGVGMLQLIASLVISGVMLARSEGRQVAIRRLAMRLAGPERGAALAALGDATVKSVVQGILGVAVIQALLAGLGFAVIGIPAAGVWCFLVLVCAIVQIPVALAMIPPILIAFSTASTGVAVAFTIWCVLVGLLDNVLKPLLFGRGVEVPMIVIFLGAIGGMLTMGIIGLFLGAVVLAVSYQLFLAWLADAEEPTRTGSATGI